MGTVYLRACARYRGLVPVTLVLHVIYIDDPLSLASILPFPRRWSAAPHCPVIRLKSTLVPMLISRQDVLFYRVHIFISAGVGRRPLKGSMERIEDVEGRDDDDGRDDEKGAEEAWDHDGWR